MQNDPSLTDVPDDELLRRLAALLARSRRAEADLVAHIGEVDRRRLYARHASPSMFAYCTEVLHLSEAEAYVRITTARAAREHPVLLDMLRGGRLHLSGIARLVSHLTRENAADLLARAAHRSKRQIEELLAEIAPRPDVPTTIRKLPERPVANLDLRSVPATASTEVLPAVSELRLEAPEGNRRTPELCPDRVVSTIPLAPPSSIEPLASERYRVQFTASVDLRQKLERLEARRFGKTKAPRKVLDVDASKTSRYIPAAIRRAVHVRDGGRCRYVDDEGRRCPERHRLEFHHRHPYGLGGDRSVGNLCLLCPAHNRYLAEKDYGRGVMARRGCGEPSASTKSSA
jgi:hypothetical protein